MTEYQYPKIMTPEISLGANMTIDTSGEFYHTTKVYSFVFDPTRREAPEYWLGILNSEVLWFFIKSTGYTLRGGYFTFKTNYLSPFPVPTIDFSNTQSVSVHDTIAKLVRSILTIYGSEILIPHEKAMARSRAIAYEEEINNLVLEIYGIKRYEKIINGEYG